MSPLLQVDHLRVQFSSSYQPIFAVSDVSFTLNKGETLGIVGESGSGKSQAVLALMGLTAKNGKVSGHATYRGESLLDMPERRMTALRGNRIALIMQGAMMALNPHVPIETQMTEVLQWHKKMSRKSAREQAKSWLEQVGIADAELCLRLYPHELSGGMCQRVLIAMALLCEPDILIADEPTSGLDVTVQAQILRLLRTLQKRMGMAIILITHDLGVVAGHCDPLLVLYAGRAMEYGAVDDIFERPSHPYTLGLMQALPHLDQEQEELISMPGEPPNMHVQSQHCPFAPRCTWANSRCLSMMPELQKVDSLPLDTAARYRACHVHPLAIARPAAAPMQTPTPLGNARH